MTLSCSRVWIIGVVPEPVDDKNDQAKVGVRHIPKRVQDREPLSSFTLEDLQRGLISTK